MIFWIIQKYLWSVLQYRLFSETRPNTPTLIELLSYKYIKISNLKNRLIRVAREQSNYRKDECSLLDFNIKSSQIGAASYMFDNLKVDICILLRALYYLYYLNIVHNLEKYIVNCWRISFSIRFHVYKLQMVFSSRAASRIQDSLFGVPQLGRVLLSRGVYYGYVIYLKFHLVSYKIHWNTRSSSLI